MSDKRDPMAEALEGIDRAAELDTDTRKRIRRALPDGAELVEGDFADDEKWRIVQTVEQPVEHTPPPPEVEYPIIGECVDCGEPIHEGEARVEDASGLWHPAHYTA
jgi:hypothetical protein